MRRIGQLISGAIHLALAVSVAPMALGRHSDSNAGTDHWTAVLMQQPMGRVLVAAIGLIAVGIGVEHFIKAHKEQYKSHMRYTRFAARLNPVVKLGLAAHGVVMCLVGTFFLWAAWTADPSHAGGMREALVTVRQAEAGHILLPILAVGLFCFGIYCFIIAAYRIVPRGAPTGLQTLASKARRLLGAGASAMRG